MSATFELYLDNVQMNDVPKFDGFEEVLERDYSNRGLIFKYPNSIQLFGDAYRYLYDIWIVSGYCNTIDVTILKVENEGRKTRIDGLIFLSDVSWSWDDGSVEVTIEDNSWSARLLNNWNIPINLKATETKNGESITPPTELQVEVYDPTAIFATWLATKARGFDLIATIRHMIEWATDNIVTFESTYLSTDWGFEVFVTKGNPLRTGVTDDFEISLSELLDSIMKQLNLWFRIVDDRDGTYTFKMEPYEDFFDTEPTQRMTLMKGVTQDTIAERLFASVSVGGEAKRDLDGTLSLPYYRMTTASKEDYYFFGECNLNDSMNLSYFVITDSNIIEDLVVNNNDDYDDAWFFLQYNSGTLRATKNKYADTASAITAPFYYNEVFLNAEILNRYTFPNTLKQTFGSDGETSEARLGSDSASLSSTSTTVNPVLWADELSDPGNNYNPANGRYTAPGNGTYSFLIDWYVALTVNNNNSDTMTVSATLVVRDSGGTQRETHTFGAVVFQGQSTSGKSSDVFRYRAEWIQYLDVNATVEVQVTMALNAGHSATTRYQYYSESKFECTATYDGGGTFIEQDPLNYRASRISFRAGISDDEWNELKDNPSAMYLIDRDGKKTMQGWALKMSRNLLTSQTSVEFITNLAQGNRIGI